MSYPWFTKVASAVLLVVLSACVASTTDSVESPTLPSSTVAAVHPRKDVEDNEITPHPTDTKTIDQAASATPFSPVTNATALTTSFNDTLFISTKAIPSATLDSNATNLDGPVVAFRVDALENYLLLYDVGTNSYREIRNELVYYPFSIQWLGNGCRLYVGTGILNLHGGVLWEQPELKWDYLLKDEAWGVGSTWLSQDNQWLAYQMWSGSQTYDSAESVDIGVVRLDEPLVPYFLTEFGGASQVAWSPDEEWLAFSDYDSNGILQVFRATPDGRIIQQLTRHVEPLAQIGYLTWSPNGDQIAYSVTNLLHTSLPYKYREKDEGWVGLISVTNLNTIQVSPAEFGSVVGTRIWWNADGSRVAFAGRGLPISDEPLSGNQIHWVEASNGVIVDSFYEADAPFGSLGMPVAVGSIDRILFTSGDGFYLLNAKDKSIEYLIGFETERGLIREAISGPFIFPGEVNCP